MQGSGGSMNSHARSRFFNSIPCIALLTVIPIWPFSLGIENISRSLLESLRIGTTAPCKVGLVTNQTGCDQRGNRSVDLLRQKGVLISHILAPEHGIDGTVPGGEPVVDSVDTKTGIPVVSVYGRGGDYSINGKRFDPNIMNQIDVLCYDMQDVGMRHYTYISTLLLALEAAAAHEKPIVVFDRPNLLGPHMEGPLVDPDPQLKSFVSLVPIPLRHGMTIGELARYFNKHILKKSARLRVVTMKAYRRTMKLAHFVPLSPNLKTLQACYGYSFLGLLGEVSPFDVGVGTTYAFQVISLPDSSGLPLHEWGKLGSLLHEYGIQTNHYTFTKRNQLYNGLRLHFSDITRIASFRLLLDLLQLFQNAGVEFSFSNLFDKATGTYLVKQLYLGKTDRNQLAQHVVEGLNSFRKGLQSSLLYEPVPYMIIP